MLSGRRTDTKDDLSVDTKVVFCSSVLTLPRDIILLNQIVEAAPFYFYFL
jgi:hypothetical protein